MAIWYLCLSLGLHSYYPEWEGEWHAGKLIVKNEIVVLNSDVAYHMIIDNFNELLY